MLRAIESVPQESVFAKRQLNADHVALLLGGEVTQKRMAKDLVSIDLQRGTQLLNRYTGKIVPGTLLPGAFLTEASLKACTFHHIDIPRLGDIRLFYVADGFVVHSLVTKYTTVILTKYKVDDVGLVVMYGETVRIASPPYEACVEDPARFAAEYREQLHEVQHWKWIHANQKMLASVLDFVLSDEETREVSLNYEGMDVGDLTRHAGQLLRGVEFALVLRKAENVEVWRLVLQRDVVEVVKKVN